jgi:hypothetical protein
MTVESEVEQELSRNAPTGKTAINTSNKTNRKISSRVRKKIRFRKSNRTLRGLNMGQAQPIFLSHEINKRDQQG